jgi:hypothetical protein
MEPARAGVKLVVARSAARQSLNFLGSLKLKSDASKAALVI